MKSRETVILSGKTNFATVRHLVLCGGNREIGRKLAEIAFERHGLRAEAIAADTTLVHELRRYFAENYPILLERSRGVAEALGIDPEDNRFDPTGIPYNQEMPTPSGCSTLFYPPSTTVTGHACLSRNYDFPIGSMVEIMELPVFAEKRESLRPVMAEPYLIEMYPSDGGYPSLSLVAFDLLSGVLDGINSEGLMVAVHGNELAIAEQGLQLSGSKAGVHELQAMRLALDTCATAGEAQKALLANRHFHVLMPCIYLVADRAGNSFVFEPSFEEGQLHVVDGSDTPQVLTNHPLHRYPSPADFPAKCSTLEPGTSSFERYERLARLLDDRKGPYSVEDMKLINAEVAVSEVCSRVPEAQRAEFAALPGFARTLWHAVYDASARSLEVKFYLRDEPTPDRGFEERYAPYFRFALGS